MGLEGVSGTYTPEELDEGDVSEAHSLLMSGYPLAEDPISSAVAKAMRTAKRTGRPIFFDPSPVADSIPPKLLREAVASLTHTLILNEEGDGPHRVHPQGEGQRGTASSNSARSGSYCSVGARAARSTTDSVSRIIPGSRSV